MKKFSQSDEQIFILDHFKNKAIGKFIDIGAYHVEKFSNTRALYLNGWNGLLIEPQPENYQAIAGHYAGEPRIEVLNFAVGEPAGDVTFYESNGDAVGTTSEQHMQKWSEGGVKYSKITVPQMGVVDFFDKYGHGTNFLSIDTEATNFELFQHIPDWVWEEIEMLCIEHDTHNEEIEEKLSRFGFTTLYINSENIILAK